MEDCLFCKIIEGVLPSFKIWEDNLSIAFLDLFPMAEGHVLVIPKEHSDNYLGLSPRLWGHMGELAKKIAEAFLAEEGEGTNFFMTHGAAAGQTVFHTHWHIIPRKMNDNVRLGVSLERASDSNLRAWQIRLARRLDYKVNG